MIMQTDSERLLDKSQQPLIITSRKLGIKRKFFCLIKTYTKNLQHHIQGLKTVCFHFMLECKVQMHICMTSMQHYIEDPIL